MFEESLDVGDLTLFVDGGQQLVQQLGGICGKRSVSFETRAGRVGSGCACSAWAGPVVAR